ncbi:MAG: hypothetical protein ACKOYN_05750 [Planctomycetota bacterium]
MADARDNAGREPSLMRNLEGFFRGIAEGLEDDGNPPQEVPADAQKGAFGRGEAREVARNVQEARKGDYILRRTTIDEVIFDPQDPPRGS